MPAIQLFLFKLKYFPTVWAVKIKLASAAYKCLVSPPRESPPYALGLGRSAGPACPSWNCCPPPATAAHGCPRLRATRSPAPSTILLRLQGHLGARGREPAPAAQDQTRLSYHLPPPLGSSPEPEKSEGSPSDRVSVVVSQSCASLGACKDPGLRRAEVGEWFQFHAEKKKKSSPPLSLCAFLPSTTLSCCLISPPLPLKLCCEEETPGAAGQGPLLWGVLVAVSASWPHFSDSLFGGDSSQIACCQQN